MNKKIFTLAILLISVFVYGFEFENLEREDDPDWDGATHLLVNHPTDEDSFDTISEAMNYIHQFESVDGTERAWSVDVFPDFDENDDPLYTVFEESFVMPKSKIFLYAFTDLETTGRGFVEISNNTTLIEIPQADSLTFDNKKEVRIYNFIFKSSPNAQFSEKIPAIYNHSRNMYLGNCEFGKRSEGRNFPSAVKCFSDVMDKLIGVKYFLFNNDFSESCDIGEYAFSHTVNTEQVIVSFPIIGFLENDFDDCGNAIYSENHNIFRSKNNTFEVSEYYPTETIAIQLSSILPPADGIVARDWIENNLFSNTTIACQSNMLGGALVATGNNIYDVDTGFKSGIYNFSDYCWNVIKVSDNSELQENIGISSACLGVRIAKNTLFTTTENSTGILSNDSEIDEQTFDNIVWGFSDSFIFSSNPDDFEITYNCYDGDVEGAIENTSTNVYSDPLFMDSANNDFHLQLDSPCINAGNPDHNVNGVPYEPGYDLQEYGSRLEIGRYDVEEKADTHTFFPNKSDYMCFPRLDRNDSNDDCDEEIQEVFTPGNYDYTFTFLDETQSIYNYQNNDGSWINGSKLIKTSTGMSCAIDSDEIVTIVNDGIVLNEHKPIVFPQPQDYAWVGFWKPRNMEADTLYTFDVLLQDVWDRVMTISADNWFYRKGELRDDVLPVKPSEQIRAFQYGKSYKIRFDQPISGFTYNYTDPTVREPKSPAKKIEFYDVAYKQDYEVIDVMDIPENIKEIGVFENDICVGAVAVDEPAEQILIYSDQSNRDSVPFELEFFDGSRASKSISYLTWDAELGKYIDKPVFSKQKKYNVVTLNRNEVTDADFRLQISQSYPNPFNLNNASRNLATISYFISESTEVEVAIYNLRGQKVKTVYEGLALAGKHKVQWSGTDKLNEKVASGVYFYQVKAKSNVSTGKMLIIK